MNIKKMWNMLINGSPDEKETEFLPAILEVTETPPSPVGRMVMWTILVLLVVGIIWSLVGKINEVAVASGKVIPTGQVKTIQVKNKGIVKEIRVKEGSYVKAGDVLVTLDPTSAGADYDSLKKRAAYFKLDIDRLNAELSGSMFSPQPSAELDAKDIAAETALYQSRVSQYRAERQAAEMTVRQKQAEVAAEQSTYEKFIGGLGIAREKEERLVQLTEQNAIAEFQLLEERGQRIQYEKSAQSQAEVIKKAQAELSEAQQKLANIDALYKKDVMTAMVEARKQQYAYEEELKKADENNRLSTITAPIDGRVYNLAVHTVGGIVTDAQALMMIVPDGGDIELEVWADNKDIGFIHEGQEAEVKIDTFNFQKFGVVKAVVDQISPDAVNDPKDPARDKKYRLSLKVSQDGIHVFGNPAELTPGMNVNAEIKIKEKRIIDFFLDPFRRYTSEALRER